MGGFGRLLGALVGAGLVGALTIGLGAMPATAALATTAAVGNTSAAVVADFGNPEGHFDVPPAGRAVDTRHPNHVIGDGRPASCTSAAVVREVAAGGIITFNRGPKPYDLHRHYLYRQRDQDPASRSCWTAAS